ncbi:MAG TPA: YggS family pyridoxal phosphate-dependent enzyme [Bacteroidales bacterium]|nr:YggS family pyridoxal phosphate-dependent enzyme [Bacteroidales bacterium]
MTDISSNILSLRKEIPGRIRIVAVSKTKPVEDIMQAYEAGHRVFGENRIPELVSKKETLPPDIEWHMIGHIQSNKVKLLIPHASLIHSIDSLKLLEIINRESEKAGVVTSCLFQFHIASEETKSGFLPDEAMEVLDSDGFRAMKNVQIKGVMGMATFTDRDDMVRGEFRSLRSIFNSLKDKYFRDDGEFCEISMGMSGDYRIAIEEGATIVRIGSLIFGSR